MVFKFAVLSVACMLIVQPAQCGIISKISDIKTAAVGTVSDIASIVPSMIKAKGSAVVQAAAQTGSIMAVGAGLKAEALGKVSSSITDAISGGLVSVGRLLSRKGTGIPQAKLDNCPYAEIGQITDNNTPVGMRKIGRRRLLARRPHAYRIIYTPRVYRGPHGTIRIQ